MPNVSPDAIASLPPPYLARGVVDQSGGDGEPSPFAKLLGEQSAVTPAATTDNATAADPLQHGTTTQPGVTAATQKPAGPSRTDNVAKMPMGGRGATAKQSTTGTAAAATPSDPVAQTLTAAAATDASAVGDSALPVICAPGSGAQPGDVARTAAPIGNNGRDSRARVSKAQAGDDQSSVRQILSGQLSSAQAPIGPLSNGLPANAPEPGGPILNNPAANAQAPVGQIVNSPASNAQAPISPLLNGQGSGGQALADKSSGQSAIGEASGDLSSLAATAPASSGQQQDGGGNPDAPQAGVPGAAAAIDLSAANADHSGSSNSGSGAIAVLPAAAATVPATGTTPAAVTAGMAGTTISAAAGDGSAKPVHNSRSNPRAIASPDDPSITAARSGTASPAVSANPDEIAGFDGAPAAADAANAATQPASFSLAFHTLRNPADADRASPDHAATAAGTGFAAALAGDVEAADASQQDLAVPANAALAAAVPAAASLTPMPAVAARAADAAGLADAPGASPANDPNAATAAVPVANIGVTLAAQAHAGNTRFEIRLEPPDLGRVDVQLSVDTSGTVSSRLVVERPETLDLLRRDAPQLERTLRDAGLDTGGGLQFALADQGFASRNWYVPQNDYAAAMPSASIAEDISVGSAGYAGAAGRGSGLDIMV